MNLDIELKVKELKKELKLIKTENEKLKAKLKEYAFGYFTD